MCGAREAVFLGLLLHIWVIVGIELRQLCHAVRLQMLTRRVIVGHLLSVVADLCRGLAEISLSALDVAPELLFLPLRLDLLRGLLRSLVRLSDVFLELRHLGLKMAYRV